MARIRNKIKPEFAEEQRGYVQDKCTSNETYANTEHWKCRKIFIFVLLITQIRRVEFI